jgi:glycosyltransferase involved in cell wall biosynthesis
VPTVVTIHDLIPLLLPAYQGGRLSRAYTRLVTIAARRAEIILTDSESSRQDILEHLHVARDRVQTIHLAGEGQYHPVSNPVTLSQVRDKYGLPKRYLLYLGGFDVRKNVPGILRAFARLDTPDVNLVVAGRLPHEDSSFFPDPRRIARQQGITDRVRFTGWVDEEDKPALYSGATAFLFPSLYEGFGLPPLEAMSCGTPVIVPDRGSLPEVVGDGGLCVDPENLDALAGAMRRIVTDASLHESLVRASLSRAKSFSWQRCAELTMAAYRRATGSRFRT